MDQAVFAAVDRAARRHDVSERASCIDPFADAAGTVCGRRAGEIEMQAATHGLYGHRGPQRQAQVLVDLRAAMSFFHIKVDHDLIARHAAYVVLWLGTPPRAHP